MQKLLSRMTGLDLDKVFAPRKEPLVLPRYRLMNKAQLEKVVLPEHPRMGLYRQQYSIS